MIVVAHRARRIATAHGTLTTPLFLPDATRASVRLLAAHDLAHAGIHAAVVNTYHLFLQPGIELIARAGGVHQFMRWPHPLLSDSGGYQIFSLIHKNPHMGRITEDGAVFRSTYNGTQHLLTPEEAIRIQWVLGVDMMVVLDDPLPHDVSQQKMQKSAARTVRWAERCRRAFDRLWEEHGAARSHKPLLFCVIQGGLYHDLRRWCAQKLVAIGFDGYGFGARHVDQDGALMEDALGITAEAIPEDALRFALGVGTPADIGACVRLGWDMFDCVIPTREGRHGRLFVWQKGVPAGEENFYETMTITRSRYREDFSPIDEACDCPACGAGYTRAYLRHLFSVGDALGARLASLHNLRFYATLMQRLQGRGDQK